MSSEIFLIGPIGVGKSTIAELLHERTMLPHSSMDLLRWVYFEEIGYDRLVAREKYNEGGIWGLYRYWKPFEAYAVKRMLEDFKECIYDFGSSQSVYEDDELYKQVGDLLAPYPYVILLMPSPDMEESIRMLNTQKTYPSTELWPINEHFVRHHSNYDLAKHIVYTKDKTPDETCNEVLQWVIENGWAYDPKI